MLQMMLWLGRRNIPLTSPFKRVLFREVSVTSGKKTDKNTVLGPSFGLSNEGNHMNITADRY